MLNRRLVFALALLIVLGAFAWGLAQLFSLRFAAGDVYPAYSSLRGDPLGCRVYFESLDHLGEAGVHRFMQSIDNLPDGRGATMFIFGLPWDEMSSSRDEYQAIEHFVRGGGRLVVTLYPELARPRFFGVGTGTNRATFKQTKPKREELADLPVDLREKWGFGYEYIPTARTNFISAPVPVQRVQPGPYPASLTWHSGLVFTNLDFTWRVLYARGTDPVMIESPRGQGSIVLATDSFFVSNEAMRKERAADLLAWLPGADRAVWFDEVHLGVQIKPGVATLARRYRLHGGVAALLVLAALFIWRGSVSFQPRGTDTPDNAPVVGRESSAGFENLLRRGLAPKDLLQTSLNEWHKAAWLDPRATPPRRERIRALLEAHNAQEKPDVVDTYREIARILNRKQ